VELDEIGHTGDAEFRVKQGHRRDDPYAFAEFGAVLMGAVMEDAAFGGVAAFSPKAFEVNERALARAVHPVLEGGERDGFVVGLHGEKGRGRSINRLQALGYGDLFR
jgi:hypothetical protein